MNIKQFSQERHWALINGFDEHISEGELSHYSIRNKDAFMEKVQAWAIRYMQVEEETVEEPVIWKVTLYVNVNVNKIYWEAEQCVGDGHRMDLLQDDEDVLLEGSVSNAEKNVREVFERDVVPKLVHISNLDEVLYSQIPKMIRNLRRGA